MEIDASYDIAALREHQLKAVKALESLDKLCKENNIKYFLIAGSTLGAIRHSGFIPWDDDIDVGLLIDDYNRLKDIIGEALPEEFEWKHTDADLSFPTLTGRILEGEDQLITVFPIVALSDSRLKAKTQWIIRKVFSQIYQRKVHYINEEDRHSLKGRLAHGISLVLSLFFSKRFVLKLLRWNEIRFKNDNTKYCINLYSKYRMEKEKIKSDWINETILAPFEGGKYPIFKSYHEYLTHLYGNYMELPPEHKRRPEHLKWNN